MELIYLTVIYNCVSCVVAALRTDYNICTGSKDIYDLAFSFVSPLSSDYNICRHLFSSFHNNYLCRQYL